MPIIKSSNQVKEASNRKSSFLALEEGKTRVRVVSQIFGVKEHRVKIGDRERTIVCPAAMEQWDAQEAGRQVDRTKKCPICEGNNTDEKKLRTQFLAIVLTENSEAAILKKGSTVFEHIAALKEEGYDLSKTPIIISRTGKGLDTEYTVIPSKDEKPVTDAEKEAVLALEKEFNLQQRATAMSYDNIVRKLNGENIVSENGGADAEEEMPDFS